MADEVEERLIGMVAASKQVDAGTIGRETEFATLGIDSLDMINLSFEIEEAFGIEIPDAAIGKLRTVGDMVAGVEGLIAAKGV